MAAKDNSFIAILYKTEAEKGLPSNFFCALIGSIIKKITR